jgi:hypothetical protein
MANLQDAHLIDADHLGATLTGAQLQSAGLSRANLLAQSSLVRTRRRPPYCRESLGADLTDTNLAAADLTEANLQRAILFDARLNRADLARADLTDAQGLLKSQIDVTFGDKDTKLPEVFAGLRPGLGNSPRRARPGSRQRSRSRGRPNLSTNEKRRAR